MSEFSIGGQKWPGISKLIEESGEVGDLLPELILMKLLGRLQQAQGKLIGSGGNPTHFDGSNLKVRLEEEMGDLFAAMNFVIISNGLDGESVNDRMQAKLVIFNNWHADEVDPPDGDDRTAG